MNPTERFRLQLQSLLARGLAASCVAAQAGLSAASEVWGGAAPRDRPAWYVWLRGLPGAWQLELADAGALAGAGSAVAGRFTVRHYPSPDAAVTASFSPAERRAAREDLDATGTPRIDAPAFPDALFTVGTLDWAIDLRGGGAAFALSTLDRLRTRAADGGLVRDVPGWRLSFPVFSAIAALHAQVERRAASRLIVGRQVGFELVEGADGAVPRDAPDTIQGDAVLLFPGDGAAPDAAADLLDALRDPAAEVVLDAALPPAGRHLASTGPGDPRLPVSVSDAWSGGAAHREDRVACGC